MLVTEASDELAARSDLNKVVSQRDRDENQGSEGNKKDNQSSEENKEENQSDEDNKKDDPSNEKDKEGNQSDDGDLLIADEGGVNSPLVMTTISLTSAVPSSPIDFTKSVFGSQTSVPCLMASSQGNDTEIIPPSVTANAATPVSEVWSTPVSVVQAVGSGVPVSVVEAVGSGVTMSVVETVENSVPVSVVQAVGSGVRMSVVEAVENSVPLPVAVAATTDMAIAVSSTAADCTAADNIIVTPADDQPSSVSNQSTATPDTSGEKLPKKRKVKPFEPGIIWIKPEPVDADDPVIIPPPTQVATPSTSHLQHILPAPPTNPRETNLDYQFNSSQMGSRKRRMISTAIPPGPPNVTASGMRNTTQQFNPTSSSSSRTSGTSEVNELQSQLLKLLQTSHGGKPIFAKYLFSREIWRSFFRVNSAFIL